MSDCEVKSDADEESDEQDERDQFQGIVRVMQAAGVSIERTLPANVTALRSALAMSDTRIGRWKETRLVNAMSVGGAAAFEGAAVAARTVEVGSAGGEHTLLRC